MNNISLVNARALADRIADRINAPATPGEPLYDTDALIADITAALDASIGRCADCRFWQRPDGSGPFEQDWNECTKALESGAPLQFEGDGGYVSTRADFGCLLFDRRGPG